MASWCDGYDPALLVDMLSKSRVIGTDGAVAFHGFDKVDYLLVVESMLRFNHELPRSERAKIVRKAVSVTDPQKVLSSKSVLTAVSKLEAAYLALPKKRFYLITSISLCAPPNALQLRTGATHTRSGVSFPPKLSLARQELIDEARDSIVGDLPTSYASVKVSVQARSICEAADVALSELDAWRGVCNLWVNRSTTWRRSALPRKPVNAIVLGPIHSLHDNMLALATQTWWYDTQYRQPVSLWGNTTKLSEMLAWAKKFQLKLGRVPYKTEMTSAIIRYCRALDSPDWNGSFLQLWSVLELLTDTGNEAYTVTVRRSAFHYKDNAYATQLLRHLRDCRNSAVHAGHESDEIERLLYQLKRFVEDILQFHVGRAGQFAGLREAAEFMDLPSDPTTLATSIASHAAKTKLLRKAEKYLG